eukprot:8833751-Alexandrium_andersonii.AAC.1
MRRAAVGAGLGPCLPLRPGCRVLPAHWRSCPAACPRGRRGGQPQQALPLVLGVRPRRDCRAFGHARRGRSGGRELE